MAAEEPDKGTTGHSELRGRRRKPRISLTRDGLVRSCNWAPTQPKSVDHFIQVLESSLRKSLVLEGLTVQHKNDPSGVTQDFVSRLTDIVRDVKREACPVTPEEKPAVEAACETLGISCDEGLLLVSRATALERLLGMMLVEHQKLRMLRDQVRASIRDARLSGELISLTRSHIRDIAGSME